MLSSSVLCKIFQLRISASVLCVVILRPRALCGFVPNINNHYPPSASNFKYLCVILSAYLWCNIHGNIIVLQAQRKLWFLKCNLKHCTSSAKLITYKTLIRTVLEYASTVWEPPTQVIINKLEMVQRKGLRFIYNKYSTLDSVSPLSAQPKWDTLNETSYHTQIVFLFLLLYNAFNINIVKYLKPRLSRIVRRVHSKCWCHSVVQNVSSNHSSRSLSKLKQASPKVTECDGSDMFLNCLRNCI